MEVNQTRALALAYERVKGVGLVSGTIPADGSTMAQHFTRLWGMVTLQRRSRRAQLFLQLLASIAGFTTLTLVNRWMNSYVESITIVTVVVIVLLGELVPAFFLSLSFILLCDYRFLPPIGSVLNTTKSFDHFIVVALTSVIVGVLVDSLRSAYRRADLAMQDAKRNEIAMERALALVSHDIRTPLTSVKMMAELISHYRNDPQKSLRCVNDIIHYLDRIDGMIQTLLDVSCIRAGQGISLKFKYCDLQLILDNTVTNLTGILGNRLVFSDRQSILGSWSEDGIIRAIENLVTNAMKYGNPESIIRLSLSRRGNRAFISVHNEGKVIPLADQARIFDDHQRVLAEKNVRGWGLGLALVKGIAVAHQGTVFVDSAEGKGTTFTLDLPILSAGSVASPFPETSAAG